MTVRVALAGCGAWGRNVLRVLCESAGAEVVAVADPSPGALAWARAACPRARGVASLEEALSLGVDAALVATPAPTHAALTLLALEAGADVFVEKPLATSTADAERCASRAAALGRVAMVGHLLRYHPTVVRLIELARQGDLGPLQRLEGERLSIGGEGSASALWALGPHDLSVLHALDPSPPRTLLARGPASGDEVALGLRLESGFGARIALSRAHPTKERRLRVVGARRVALFDDVRRPDRLLVGRPAGPGRELSLVREERVAWREPLALELEHFLRCVEERARPRTPFDEGAQVVRVLARAEAALERPPVAAPWP